MTVVAWLGCGLLAAAVAWLARPDAYPGGPATAVAAGLCGGFLGGAFVALIAGDRGALAALGIAAAATGAIVMLDLAERTAGSSPGPSRTPILECWWSWACLVDPLLVVVVVGVTLGVADDSPTAAVLASLSTTALFYWHRNHASGPVWRWRRRRG